MKLSYIFSAYKVKLPRSKLKSVQWVKKNLKSNFDSSIVNFTRCFLDMFVGRFNLAKLGTNGSDFKFKFDSKNCFTQYAYNLHGYNRKHAWMYVWHCFDLVLFWHFTELMLESHVIRNEGIAMGIFHLDPKLFSNKIQKHFWTCFGHCAIHASVIFKIDKFKRLWN